MFRFLTRRWRLTLILVLAAVTLTSAAFWFQSWRAQREFEETVAMIPNAASGVA